MNPFSVEDFLIHDLYTLAAFAEQSISSEKLKEVSFFFFGQKEVRLRKPLINIHLFIIFFEATIIYNFKSILFFIFFWEGTFRALHKFSLS